MKLIIFCGTSEIIAKKNKKHSRSSEWMTEWTRTQWWKEKRNLFTYNLFGLWLHQQQNVYAESFFLCKTDQTHMLDMRRRSKFVGYVINYERKFLLSSFIDCTFHHRVTDLSQFIFDCMLRWRVSSLMYHSSIHLIEM